MRSAWKSNTPHRRWRTCRRLSPRFSDQITRKIERLRAGLVGDVKALSNAEAGYRLRSGDFRVLFDSDGKTVVIRRVLNRRDAYR